MMAKSDFSVPENFDVMKEYHGGRLKLHTGGNDWESSYTCFMLMRRPDYRGDSERIWVVMRPPEGYDDFGYVTDEEKARGVTDGDKTAAAEKQGESFVRKWEDAVRDLCGGDGRRVLSDNINRWYDALDDDELRSMISDCGRDRSQWVGRSGGTWFDRSLLRESSL
jgi:hypothetical protein